MPFLPRSNTSPIPCEIEGINIGKVTKIEKNSLKRKLQLTVLYANPHARAIEIIVAITEALIELKRDTLNLGNFVTTNMSERVIFISIATRGQITVIKRNTQIIYLIREEY
jgi:hypothetical protein